MKAIDRIFILIPILNDMGKFDTKGDSNFPHRNDIARSGIKMGSVDQNLELQ